MYDQEMAPNPDVLQIRLGALVTLVLIRDRGERCWQLYIDRQGAVMERVGVTIPEDQGPRLAKFLNVPLYVGKSRVTDDPPVEVDPADEITRPEGKPEK